MLSIRQLALATSGSTNSKVGKPADSVFQMEYDPQDPTNLLDFVDDFINYKDLVRLHSVVHGESFGVFFVMPHWLAKFILFIARHDCAVQDQLINLKYRALEHFEGAECAEGDSIICGYNIGECPAWARPTGLSFLGGHDISQSQRDFVKKLGDEYRLRVDELLEREKEDGEEEEEGTDDASLPVSSGTQGVPTVRQDIGASTVRQHTYSAAEVGAAVAAASERSRLFNKLDQLRITCRQSGMLVRRGGREGDWAWVGGWAGECARVW